MTKTYLLQADLDLTNMARWSAQNKYSDPDRALHCLVYHTFPGDKVPRAFAAVTDPNGPRHHAKLYAYTGLNEDELRDVARMCQMEGEASIMSPFTFRTKEIPDEWQEGSTVGFRVRVRPTYRDAQTKAERDISNRPDIPAGIEIEDLYCNWLSDLLAKKAKAEAPPEAMRVVNYQRRRVKRQENSNWTTGPDVTIEGRCRILCPDEWGQAVRYGIGRHKPYGYGMLLLRSAASLN